MPNPTSGFQLSALPQPLSFPTNIGTLDVGQMQKAYSNAMQNVQDTALFGQRVAAQRAALDYQEQLARQQAGLLGPQAAAQRATYGATTATQTNVAREAEAKGPYVGDIAKNVAEAERLKTGIDLSGFEALDAYKKPISELKAQATAYQAGADAFVQSERYKGGGFIKRELKIGDATIPYFVDASGHVSGLPASLINTALSKIVTGENIVNVRRSVDANGNETVTQRVELIHPSGQRTVLKEVTLPSDQARKEGFVPYKSDEPEVHPENTERQQSSLNLPALTPMTGLPSFGPVNLSYSQNQPLATFAAPSNQALQTQAAPATQVTQPASTPAEQAPSSSATAAQPQQTQPQAQKKIAINWLNDAEVNENHPAAKVKSEFDKYWQTHTRGTPLADKDKPVAKAYQEEINKVLGEFQSKSEALSELAKAVEKIDKDGISTGTWQKYIPAGLLQLMGDPTKQSFTASVNELVNKLSESSRFRNFAVVDLIRSTKPEEGDDPQEVARKLKYYSRGMQRIMDAAQAANEGMSQGIAPMKVQQAVNRNYTNIPYDKFVRENAMIAKPTASTKFEVNPSKVGYNLSFEEWKKQQGN